MSEIASTTEDGVHEITDWISDSEKGGTIHYEIYVRWKRSGYQEPSQTANASTSYYDLGTRPSASVSLLTAQLTAGSTAQIRYSLNLGDAKASNASKPVTVTRFHRNTGDSSFTGTVIYNGTVTNQTLTDTIPASYGGGEVYYSASLVYSDSNYVSNSNASVSSTTATKTVISNSAPTTPASLTVPTTIAGGSNIEISWGSSTDPDGNLAGYILERSVDGGSTWTQVYKGAALTTADAIIAGTTRVRYRVKAYDTYGAESGYRLAPSSGGDYTVSNNRAPSTPASPITISPAALTTGISAVITWGASEDPDGDAFDYSLERSVDGLTDYEEIYRGSARNYTDTVGAWSTVSYRVRAIDAFGAASPYRTADTKTVSSNAAPTITCSYNDGEDVGTKSAAFSFTYSVGDTNTADELTVKEIVDGVVRKTISDAERGTNYTFNFRTGSASSTSYWKKLLDGPHTVTLEVSDGKATARRTITFLKNVGSCVVTLKNAIDAAAGTKIGVAAVSICGSIPAGCLTSVEVTADDGTHWERCDISSGGTASGIGGRKVKTSADLNEELLGGHYLFLHKLTNAGTKFNFRITCTAANGQNGYISSVQGTFTEIGTSDTAVFQ